MFDTDFCGVTWKMMAELVTRAGAGADTLVT